MDEYENLVVAVAMIDAAIRALEEAENQDQVVEYLHETRNRLNDDRIVCLGNGRGRPFWAADRIEELEAKLATCRKYRDAYAECDRISTHALRKAVEALEKLADCVDDGCFCSEMEMATAMDNVRTTLAELKGKTDE